MTRDLRQRTPRKSRRGGPLSADQRLSLLHGHSIFSEESELWTDPDHRREAWFANRDGLMRGAPAGERPEAWWRYEAPTRPLRIYPTIDVRPYWRETELGAIARCGELTAAEEALYEADEFAGWREEYSLWPRRPCDVYDLHEESYGEPQDLRRSGLRTTARVLGEMRREAGGWRVTCGTCGVRLPDAETRRDGAENLAEHHQRLHRDARSGENDLSTAKEARRPRRFLQATCGRRRGTGSARRRDRR